MTRPNVDQYFMSIAKQVASRSTCMRRKVGAILVRDRNILATGYNGSIKGLEHCIDVGCLMEENHCIRTVHAEANALIQAAKNGTNINGSTIYTTASPCWGCFKLIVNAGVQVIRFSDVYVDGMTRVGALKLNISMEQVT